MVFIGIKCFIKACLYLGCSYIFSVPAFELNGGISFSSALASFLTFPGASSLPLIRNQNQIIHRFFFGCSPQISAIHGQISWCLSFLLLFLFPVENASWASLVLAFVVTIIIVKKTSARGRRWENVGVMRDKELRLRRSKPHTHQVERGKVVLGRGNWRGALRFGSGRSECVVVHCHDWAPSM